MVEGSVEDDLAFSRHLPQRGVDMVRRDAAQPVSATAVAALEAAAVREEAVAAQEEADAVAAEAAAAKEEAEAAAALTVADTEQADAYADIQEEEVRDRCCLL